MEQTAVLASAIERHAASWSPEQFSDGVDDYGKRVSAARERR